MKALDFIFCSLCFFTRKVAVYFLTELFGLKWYQRCCNDF